MSEVGVEHEKMRSKIWGRGVEVGLDGRGGEEEEMGRKMRDSICQVGIFPP